MRKKTLIIVIILFTFHFSPLTLSPAQAAPTPTCMPIYGGGPTTRQYCITPTPTPKQAAKPTAAAKTKGGLPIYPPSKTKTTPNTGPEMLGLALLLLAGGAGVFLQKKSNKQQRVQS